MTKITDGGPKDLLPPVLKDDPEVQALSYAIEEAAKLILQLSRRTLMYAAIDEQPEYILDYMAVESRALYYDESMDIETKRRIIKNSLAWYMTAGTQECVDELIETVFSGGKSVPWYEFEDGPGKPGTFDIITSTQMEPLMYERFSRIIEKAKNKSSVLRYITIEHTEEKKWTMATGLSVEESETVSNDIHIDDPEQALFLNEYISISEESQATDKLIVGELKTTIEHNNILIPMCALSEETEMVLNETFTEMDCHAQIEQIGCMAAETEQTIRSSL